MGEFSFEDVTAVMQQLTSDEGATIVKAPRQTLVRGEAKNRGSEALETLRRLRFDPGRLVDLGPLAAGGMSAIRVAKQVSLDREVAVKRLPMEKRMPRHIEALLSEAWVTGALEHPNIVPVHDMGLDEDGMPVLVMKKIEGESWGELLRGGDLAPFGHEGDPLAFHLRAFMSVCNAAHFAHARGIVHRDLKPDNVMVGYFGEVYVVDWGIATPPKPAKSIAGTPAYLAPEMLARPGDELTPATDIYLLGAILYEILTGAPPHLGETMEAIIESVLASPPKLPESAPVELVQLATACMNPNPRSRPPSADFVRKAVERFFAHEGSRALAREAAARADELAAEIAKKSEDRTRAHALFTECRFGFKQAIRTWPRNLDAIDGLERTTEAMIRYELARRDGQAASLLLSELANPTAALRAEVDAVVAATESERKKLRDLERRHSPTTGNRQRRFFGVMFGALFTLSPLVGHALGMKSMRDLVGGSIFVPVLALAVLAVTWRRVTASAITRGLMTIFAYAMAVQGAVATAVLVRGADTAESATFLVLLPFYWAFALGLNALLFERRFFTPALAYAIAGFGSLLAPDWRFAFIAGANFGICISAYILWPTTLDEKREPKKT